MTDSPPSTATTIAEYSKVEGALADLRQRFGSLVADPKTKDGMTQLIDARAELRGYRVDLEKTRKDIKAPALERCNLIDAEAKRITRALESLEDPIDAQIKAEEDRKAAEKAAKEAAEQQRVADLQLKLSEFPRAAANAVGKSPGEIADLIADYEAAGEPDETHYAEFVNTAKDGYARMMQTLRQLHAGACAQQTAAAEAKRKAAEERAELDRLRKEEAERAKKAEEERAARHAEIEREQVEARKKMAEEREIERKRMEEEHKARMAERAEEDRLRREEDEKRRAAEAEVRRQREEVEAREAEIRKRELEMEKAENLLAIFVQSYGSVKRYAAVVKAIKALPALPTTN